MPKPRLTGQPPTVPADSFLAAIVDSADDAIVSKDLNGVVSSWNNAAERIFGYTAAEAVGRPITLIIPPERAHEETHILSRIRRGEGVEHFTTVRRRKDGKDIEVSVTISPIRDAEGKIIGASKIARDITRERITADELRAAEERFRLTLSSIGDGVIATDMDGKVSFMNNVAEELTGWPEAEAISKPLNVVFNIINEFSRKSAGNPVEKVLREGAIVGLANHTILVARNGEERPIADSAAPIRDPIGRLSGVVLVFRDETAARAARMASARLAALVENSEDAIIGKDLNGIITSWNKGAQRIFGYTPKEIIGKLVTILMPPELQDEEQKVLARIRGGEPVGHFETVRITKEGRLIDVSVAISPIVDVSGEIIGASKLARDITVQKRAEEARLRLAAIVESSDDAIISKNLDGIIQTWNRGAERIFGYTSAETIGKHITLLIPPDRHAEEVDILARLRRGERIDHYQTVRIAKDRRQIHVSLSISPLQNSAGVIVGASKIVRDITPEILSRQALEAAQKQLQEQAHELENRVQERTAQLQASVAELEAFSYTVSHDLRAPLRGMQQFAQILLTDHAAQLNDEARNLLNRIVASSARLDSLIRDVLAYSRVLRMPMDLQPVNLGRLVAQILDHNPALQEPAAQIRIRSPLSAVQGNEAFLTQCVSNLLMNAVKFVPRGVTPTVEVWTEKKESMVRLYVKDNGIGIAPEFHNQIFGMFQRLHTAKEFEGTGIGLAIVRKAVERMGGSASVESELGKGSTFCITLPSV